MGHSHGHGHRIRARRAGAARLARATWPTVVGVACPAGIGFTMSLVISGLAAPDAVLLAQTKLGIVSASVMAGEIGASVIWFSAAPMKTSPAANADDADAVGRVCMCPRVTPPRLWQKAKGSFLIYFACEHALIKRSCGPFCFPLLFRTCRHCSVPDESCVICVSLLNRVVHADVPKSRRERTSLSC